MQTEIREGWIYFKKNGKIEIQEMLNHGSIELVFNDGNVNYINISTKKNYNTDWTDQRYIH